MAKWEYCRYVYHSRAVVPLDYEQGEKHNIEILDTPSGQKLAVWGYLEFYSDPLAYVHDTDIVSVIRRLGSEGWEMVSHTELQSMMQVFYFKRLIEGGAD